MNYEDIIALGKREINAGCERTSFGNFYVSFGKEKDVALGALLIMVGIMMKKDEEG